MDKKESQKLMIGSWVLADGKPRQVNCLTIKKAGFKRGTNGHCDFYRFDQLQGIPLSEPLLKECVTYRPTGKQQAIAQSISIHCYSDTVIEVRIDGNTKYYHFCYLHEVQSFLLSTYQLQVKFDVEKYKKVSPIHCVILSDMKDLNISSIDKKEIAGLGDVVYIMPKDKVDDSGLKSDKSMFDELFRTPPDGFIIPDDKQGYILRKLSDEDKRDVSRKMGWIKD